jgi:hypothetical protein
VTRSLSVWAAEDTYKDVDDLVGRFVWDFHLNTGIELEECRSEGLEGYVEAYHSYQPGRGEFTTWVGVKVRSRLLDLARRLRREGRRLKGAVDAAEVAVAKAVPDFRLDEFVEELSEDARTVVSMVFDTPIDVKVVMYRLGGDQDTPQTYRGAIREVLRDLGWTRKRIKESFQEIRRAL